MHYWEKLKSYFLDGCDVFSLEIQHKLKYLFYFNVFATVGLILYYITRIFNPGSYAVMAGDFCLFLFVAISFIAIRLKKIHAVTLSVIFIPIAVLFYNAIRFYALDQEISPTTIFSSLSLLMFGLLYLSLFSVRVNQLIFFALISAATLMLNCFFLINGPFGFRVSESAIYSLVGALLELAGGTVIASLILKLGTQVFKNNEKSLLQSREHYASLFSNIVDSFTFVKVITDKNGQPTDIMVLEINKATEDFLKIKREEVVFRKFSEILDPEMIDHENCIKEVSTVAFTGKEHHKTVYSKHLKKWLYIQVFSPEMNYCAILIRDISATVESDHKIKRIQERNVALLEAIPDTILVCDRVGFIKTYKRAQIKLVENEILFQAGNYIAQANLPEELISQIMNSIAEVLNTNKLKTMVLEIPTESRVLYAETRLVPLGEDEVLILFRDLTRRILSEKALLIEKEKAEESDRLKMAFLANMSHEIRTPMNAIIGFSEMLNLTDLDDKERGDFIYQIQSNGALLLNLINDILDLSKIEAGELEIQYSKFDINKILYDIYLNFENEKFVRNKSGIQIILEPPPDILNISINADEYRFKQVLFNLMGNALKFTTAGSITLGYKLIESEILFYVKDTGIGIPKDKQEIIFHRFRQVEDTTTRTFGGAGLGLTISRSLVEAMGGRIWVELNEHNGSSFFFTLPLNDATISYSDKTSSSPYRDHYNWKGKSILIIEKEASNFVEMQHLLAKTGVNMEWASNDLKVIAICHTRKPDLVILDADFSISENESIEAELKKQYPTLPIIALKSGEEIINGQALPVQIDALIPKPIKARVFLETINKYLAQ